MLLSGSALLASSATDARYSAPAHRAQSVALGDVRLRVVRSGHGFPVVLLHGYGESLLSWRAVFDDLARHADVIAFDLPGFGLSSKLEHGFTADSVAATTMRLLDRLHVERAILVGHSLGGAVAAAVAVRDPRRIAGLVLVDPALATPPMLGGAPDTDGQSERLRELVAAYYEGLRSRFAPAHDPDWLLEDSVWAAYEPASDPAYRLSLVAVLRQFDFEHLSPDRAARLTMPTLLIWGTQDPVVPVGSARRLAAMLPNAQVVLLGRSWHRPHVERPSVVSDLIKRFLVETTGGPEARAY